MRIAITGATGFLGHYIVARLAANGHDCRCWYRPTSDRGGLQDFSQRIRWLRGELGDSSAAAELVDGCDAVVHAALYHPGGGFHGGEGDLLDFVDKNVLGALQLIEAARRKSVGRFIFISTCAVHEKILDDRALDETHPTWALSHYGAHKAAIEQFVHSYGYGQDYPICALRPTGIYGLARPVQNSKWYGLVRNVVRGETVECRLGGKEVHAGDVARAVELLLTAEGIAGEAYSCYDRYISEYEVATIARRIADSGSEIRGSQTAPKHQIVTEKLRALGMQFGGQRLLEQTIAEMVTQGRRAE
jgi:nucleoside-diphosphate-sugar epimerase